MGHVCKLHQSEIDSSICIPKYVLDQAQLQVHCRKLKKAVQETVEPLMEQYKPPGLIKKIYFKNLSFGDAPFKVENVWVEDEGEKHVLMEVHNLLCQRDFTGNAKCLATLRCGL